LVANLVLRPKVLIDVGEPIDVRALAGLDGPGPQPEPDPDEVRALADQVMAELIALVATLRGEPAPHPTGVDRA
jgi:hypothetical protein